MPYEPKYKPESFLEVLDNTKPTNLSYISKIVGCSRDVAKMNILQLEMLGKVKKVETLGVKENLWIKI
jgi:hypothetical protein